MILPPFEPPNGDELRRFWLSCTYRDVHRMILEVLHGRLSLMEFAGAIRSIEVELNRLLPEDSSGITAARRLRRMIEQEQFRAGPIDTGRERVAHFSDEWRAMQAIRCRFFAHPDGEPGDDQARLPRFQRLAWTELRNAWRDSGYTKGGRFEFEQRALLEIAFARRMFAHCESLARRVEKELVTQGANSEALPQLLLAIRFALDERQ